MFSRPDFNWVLRSLRVFLFDYLFCVFEVTIGSILRFEEDGVDDEEDCPRLKGSFGSENGGFCGGAESEHKPIYSVSPSTSKNQFNAGREIKVLNELYVENPPEEFSGEFPPVEAAKAEVLEKGEEQEILFDNGHGDSEEEVEFGPENNDEILAGEEAMDEQKMKHEIEHNNETDSQFFTDLPEIQVVEDDYTDSDLISSSDEGRESEILRETKGTSSDAGDKFHSSDDDYKELKLQTDDSTPASADIPPLEDSKKLDEEDEQEILPEHDVVIEQLKRELRSARPGRLPTIWEEGSDSESSIMIQGLKSWKLDQKLERRDQMEEIRKVYNAYEQKMRKLDILNNQTMHAIDFLQLKNQNRSISDHFWPRKSQKSAAEPGLKFIGDLHREMELVYIGQICLSWEILNWQRRKVLELQEHNPEVLDRCITNAGDFQTFQIFMERLIESDRFHGSRVENYVRNRYVMRRFLQVPAINGGRSKEKKNLCKTKYANFGGNQAKMIDESMRIFCEFIRADKDGWKRAHINLEDPADFNLLNNIRANLHKKEKKLKEMARSKRCIAKKLHKNRGGEDDTKQVVAEVELKLVSRVLRMSKLTKSHLLWCSQKLNHVVFFKGKIYIEEPNFLLFPF